MMVQRVLTIQLQPTHLLHLHLLPLPLPQETLITALCWTIPLSSAEGNDYCQLGIDNTTRMGDKSSEMAFLPIGNLGTGRTATATAAVNYHSCALLVNASVKCWGYNGVGRLGIDNNTNMGNNSGEMAVLPSIDL